MNILHNITNIKEKNILKDLIFWPTIICVFILDQLSKSIVINIFKNGKVWPEESPIRLAYVTNTGSAFGLFQNATIFLVKHLGKALSLVYE